MLVRTALTGACCALVLAGITGCQGDDVQPEGARLQETGKAPTPAPGAALAIRKAADVTTSAKSSRTRTTMTMQSDRRVVTLTGEGTFDYVRHVGSLTIDAPKDSGIAGPLQEILTPDALYMKNAAPGIPKDKWIKLSIAGLGDGNLVSGGGTDPGTSFEILRGVNDDVVLVGTEKLGNDTVRHYKGTLDIRKAHDLTPPEVRGPLAAALKTFDKAPIPFDAYLDETGRLRKVEEQFAFLMGPSDGAKPAPTTKVVSGAELYDFGVRVDVTVPAEKDIYVPPAPSTPPAKASGAPAPTGKRG
ncbi:hypothetical protein [Streptomyces sp. SID3343]|uniref:hypothetical protein n=1 Tax=Streptomyces sp. SID3343 TaxID=2690260 RepID=UPI00136D0C98|nr:hypothetical protein [Streptomyces sp. SID3343]MYW06453.1 hypothetical protein [Streptomyces sp. SID3343]